MDASTGKNKEEKQGTPKSSSARLREIIRIFLRYNVLGHLAKQEQPEKVRLAFELLGPTFIKIGQMLSVRTDILTPPFIQELRKLQDNVPVDEYSQVKKVVEAELGQPIEAVFESFDEQPIASASIGQTHHGVLLTGEHVAVKVQHPGIKEEIHLDLNLFAKALPLIKYIPESTVINPKETFLEVKNSLQNELDFLKEAENGIEFYQKNNDWEVIRVPRIFSELCTPKLITMSFMTGESLKEFNQRQPTETISEEQLQQMKKEIGDTLVRNFVKQVFEDGFFHADPHPGNLLIQLNEVESNPSGESGNKEKSETKQSMFYAKDHAIKNSDYRIVFLDFGMMGRLSPEMTHKLTAVMESLFMNRSQQIGRAVLNLCNQVGPIDEDAFFEALTQLLDNHYGMSIGEINLQQLFFKIVNICHKNNLQVPQEVTMLVKAVATFEGVIRELDPAISLVEIATPFAKKYFLEKVNWSEELKKSAVDVLLSAQALPKIPARTLDVLEDLSKGKTKLTIEIKKQMDWFDRMETVVNRLIVGFIIGALLIGSSLLVMTMEGNQRSFPVTLGLLGYGIAAILSILLIVTAVRKRRK